MIDLKVMKNKVISEKKTAKLQISQILSEIVKNNSSLAAQVAGGNCIWYCLELSG